MNRNDPLSQSLRTGCHIPTHSESSSSLLCEQKPSSCYSRLHRVRCSRPSDSETELSPQIFLHGFSEFCGSTWSQAMLTVGIPALLVLHVGSRCVLTFLTTIDYYACLSHNSIKCLIYEIKRKNHEVHKSSLSTNFGIKTGMHIWPLLMCHKYNCVYLFLPWHPPQKADRTGRIQHTSHPSAHLGTWLKVHSERGEPRLNSDYRSALIGFIKYGNI